MRKESEIYGVGGLSVKINYRGIEAVTTELSFGKQRISISADTVQELLGLLNERFTPETLKFAKRRK